MFHKILTQVLIFVLESTRVPSYLKGVLNVPLVVLMLVMLNLRLNINIH